MLPLEFKVPEKDTSQCPTQSLAGEIATYTLGRFVVHLAELVASGSVCPLTRVE